MIHESATPLMKQYFEIKQQFPDTLLLFQVGDFYELFFQDAQKAASFLGIALTKRGKNNGEPIPLCGVPVHALDHYLTKLIKGGFKVALCDQLHEARPGKMVERGVTRVFTPGTLTDGALLDAKKASYLFSFFPLPNAWGLLFGELLTAQLFATVVSPKGEKTVESELIRFFPDEILVPSTALGKAFQTYFKQLGYFTSCVDYNEDTLADADGWLSSFKQESKTALDTCEPVRRALYTMHAYLRVTQEASLAQFNQLQWYQPDDFLMLDGATQRNLELVKNNHDAGRTGTLLNVMDGAMTPMGSRMIKKWLLRPLIKQEAIVQRHDSVQIFVENVALIQQLKELLTLVGDAERIIGRIALRRATVNDYLMLTKIVAVAPTIAQLLKPYMHVSLLATIVNQWSDFSALHTLLVAALNDDAGKEWIIKKGFDAKLDAIRDLVESGNQKIMELEAYEQQATGIGSLKIRYNSVHGYSIEITKTHYDAVPAHYIRRQTLVGRERFTTAQLQQLEHEIAQARTDIVAVEQAVFESVKQAVQCQIVPLRKCAHALAHLDALIGFATIAYDYGYVRPMMHASRDLRITKGRHPVVERTVSSGFIPNDTLLTDEQSLWIITGPNMGGKSTYLRQVALLSIMAQCGSYIPAHSAQLPILDRIFTRIGAGDNLVGGKSTFMVEMEETASICTQATKQSLVILDEVGRGTSTFDGLALAQAVVEYLYTTVGARCLFATHYHELTLLAQQFPGIVNYYAANSKTEAGIIFLYTMVPGVANGSFGIEVAKLAALPKPIIARAQQLVTALEGGSNKAAGIPARLAQDEYQRLALYAQQLEERVNKQEQQLGLLQQLDYNNLSPKQAFDLLWRLKEQGGQG